MQWPINRAQISKFQDFKLCNLCIQNVVTAINASRNIYACINKCRYRVQPACLHRRVVMVISCIIYTSELMITCLTRRKMRWQWHVYERLRIIIVHRVLQYCSNLISDSMQYQHHHLHTSSQHPSHSCSCDNEQQQKTNRFRAKHILQPDFLFDELICGRVFSTTWRKI